MNIRALRLNRISVEGVKNSRAQQIVLGIVVALLIILILGGAKFLQIRSMMAEHANFKMPPEAVTASNAKLETWPRELTAIGSLAAVQGVTLSTENPGTVNKINFESGEKIEKGRILVELDASVETGDLKSVAAVRDLALQALNRAQTLAKSNANSKADLEKAVAEYRTADAQVASLQAKIDRKKIIAPFDGRAGIREVNLGQYVTAGTPIVPLFSLDPIYVNFSLPQQHAAVLKAGQKVRVVTAGISERTFEGTITAVNPDVNPNNRNISVQATLDNHDEVLRPGMFAQVAVVLPESDQFITVPTSSVSFAPYGDTVYVIEELKDPANVAYLGVRQQIVKLGKRRGDQIAILSGVKEGEKVVSSGTFKLRPGAAVAVNDAINPGNDPAPHPADT